MRVCMVLPVILGLRSLLARLALQHCGLCIQARICLQGVGLCHGFRKAAHVACNA